MRKESYNFQTISYQFITHVFCLCVIFIYLVFNGHDAFAGSEGKSFFPDQYELDDTAKNASEITLNALAEQTHNFHKANDQDWIQFHALKSDTSIEIKAYDLGEACEPVITLYYTDALTVLDESRNSWNLDPDHPDKRVNLYSWRPLSDGLYYVKLTNKNGEQFGSQAGYSLRVGRPLGPRMGYIEGIITNAETGNFVGGAVITTVASSAVSSYQSEGYYVLLSPAGDIAVTIKKTGYQTFTKNVIVGEAARVELSVSLTPSYAYHSSYELAQWIKRANDSYYCVNICDLNGNVYSGLQDIRCGEDFHAWSAKNYINLILGIPDSTLSGFQFMWKVWSPTGYGGEGFEGVIIVP